MVFVLLMVKGKDVWINLADNGCNGGDNSGSGNYRGGDRLNGCEKGNMLFLWSCDSELDDQGKVISVFFFFRAVCLRWFLRAVPAC